MTNPNPYPYGEPRAHIERQFGFDQIAIHLGTRMPSEFHLYEPVNPIIHAIRDTDPESHAVHEPFLRLPENLARALLDALAAYFGGISETRQLRTDYNAERARVDRLLEHVATMPASRIYERRHAWTTTVDGRKCTKCNTHIDERPEACQ